MKVRSTDIVRYNRQYFVVHYNTTDSRTLAKYTVGVPVSLKYACAPHRLHYQHGAESACHGLIVSVVWVAGLGLRQHALLAMRVAYALIHYVAIFSRNGRNYRTAAVHRSLTLLYRYIIRMMSLRLLSLTPTSCLHYFLTIRPLCKRVPFSCGNRYMPTMTLDCSTSACIRTGRGRPMDICCTRTTWGEHGSSVRYAR